MWVQRREEVSKGTRMDSILRLLAQGIAGRVQRLWACPHLIPHISGRLRDTALSGVACYSVAMPALSIPATALPQSSAQDQCQYDLKLALRMPAKILRNVRIQGQPYLVPKQVLPASILLPHTCIGSARYHTRIIQPISSSWRLINCKPSPSCNGQNGQSLKLLTRAISDIL